MLSVLALKQKVFWTCSETCPIPGESSSPSYIGCLGWEVRTTDPHDPSKEIVYSGTPLVETLKAGGLLLDSGMGGLRETVKKTVIVEATDGYRAVFSLAELDPELTDRIIPWLIPRTVNCFPSARGLCVSLFPARNGQRAGCAKSRR